MIWQTQFFLKFEKNSLITIHYFSTNSMNSHPLLFSRFPVGTFFSSRKQEKKFSGNILSTFSFFHHRVILRKNKMNAETKKKEKMKKNLSTSYIINFTRKNHSEFVRFSFFLLDSHSI